MPPGSVKTSSAQLYPSDPIHDSEETPEGDEPAEDSLEAPSTETDEVDVEELLKAIPEDQEEVTEEMDTSEFDKQFQARFKMSPDEAVALVEELRGFQTQLNIHQQQLDLSQAWGIPYAEVGTRLQAVKKAWDKLPPDAQEKLDNPEGAKTIWAYIEGKRAIPALQTNKTKGTSRPRSFDFTKSEISRMSDQEYQANIQAISTAFQTGRVDLSK